jgi:CHASE2 domain-containing sensor protein
VIIGVTAPSASDYWFTPYTTGQQAFQKQIPGVFLQAQMVSQILSAVLDKRPLIWVWDQWSESLWIWGWSIVGGILALRLRSLLHLELALILATRNLIRALLPHLDSRRLGSSCSLSLGFNSYWW